MTKVIFNGNIIEEKDANVSIADKGYFFDFAVYSSMKVIQGKIFFPDYHVVRLFESAKLIGLEHNFSEKEVLNWLNKLVEINKTKDSLLRAVLIGDPDNNKAKLFIFPISGLTYYPSKLYKHGAKVITYHGERLIPQSKTKNMLMGFMALREAKNKSAIEALLIDNLGNIREGTRTNFFAIKDKTIFTAPDNEVLEGITRKIILEISKKDFDIKHEDIPAN
ncbi:MAG: aminotransferase class IV, partial [Candidatus Pacebacteria bacterium]|nr:aminotransferase class IV [Candidatus Paceibacterota bacterium]